jgi:hypothetical protein
MISSTSKKWRIILPTLILAFHGTACGKQCREAKEAILEPTDRVVQYLSTRPTGEELANAGCTLILSEFERLPEGAATIKRIADERFKHTESRCVRWERADRYVCRYSGGPYYRYRHCRWEPYSYCGAYDTDLIEEPGYREAVELSRNLDLTFERTQKLCRLAETGDSIGAEFASRDLLAFLTSEVRPDSDRVYAMACGSGASGPGSDNGWDD